MTAMVARAEVAGIKIAEAAVAVAIWVEDVEVRLMGKERRQS